MDEKLKPAKIYYCVDYPGLVEDEKEAIKTLGGMSRIEQTFQKRNAKLLLNFNPENIFAKNLCSTQLDAQNQPFKYGNNAEPSDEPHSESGKLQFDHENQKEIASFALKNSDVISMPCFVLSVKKQCSNLNAPRIVARCDRMYLFQKLADFQYLPMNSLTKANNANNNQTQTIQFSAFYDQFRFNLIDNYEQDLRRNQIPQLFILPPFFSRFDDPVSYSFKSEAQQKSPRVKESEKEEKKKNENSEEKNGRAGDESESDEEKITKAKEENSNGLIKSIRQERSSLAFLLTFNCKQIPSVPNPKLKAPRSEALAKCITRLREMFELRPCFLKSVLLGTTNFSPALLKEALPYVAYYFTTGPWRSCWIRFGYDPRLCPEAKIFQMIDYRLRYAAEPDLKVKAKPRASYHKRKFRSDLSESDTEDYKNPRQEPDMYKFRPDKLPMSRNVFYQLCDIEDEDVQALIGSEENKPNECSEKDGWCLSNVQDKCRDIMSQKHEKLSKQISTELKESNKLKK